jgi:integrase
MAARAIGKLTALKVEKAKEPGMYGDGGGLYLRVTEDGAKNWVFRFMLNGRARWMGLGPLALYGLQEARGRALDARRLRHEGMDPIDTRRAARLQERLKAAKAMTFKQCAEAYIASHRAGWRNEKHAGQWETTLATYAYPAIGALPVQSIDTGLVLRVLEPIWTEKSETAGRVRGRIEAILDWAKARDYRAGENPARWRGHVDKLLPARNKVRKVEHHAALPYAELPGFMLALRGQEGNSARALEFAILTAARTGEVIGATWDEINWTEKVWTIDGARMKAGKEHRVPLCDRATMLLTELEPNADDTSAERRFLFAGGKAGRPLSNMAMDMLLRRMNSDVTVHGFRSTFRDWAAERTNFPSEVVEMALAHTISSKVEKAYRRGDLFEKRRRLMDTWADFCAKPPASGTVVSLRASG